MVQNVGVTGTWCRILVLVTHGAECRYCWHMVQNVGVTGTWCRILVLVANVQNVGVTDTWCRM